MAGLSRLEKLGTVFTRTRNLIRAGVITEKNKPVWFDVMQAFPPIEEPLFHRKTDQTPLKQILYPEDTIRAKFYEVYGSQGSLDLNKHSTVQRTSCYRFIQKYEELEIQGNVSEDQLFEATADALRQEGLLLRKRKQYQTLADQVHISEEQNMKRVRQQPIVNVDIGDMIKKAIAMSQKAEHADSDETFPAETKPVDETQNKDS
ncbi:small ribosomal subunit protein mS23-like [Glandiceps talaboti]